MYIYIYIHIYIYIYIYIYTFIYILVKYTGRYIYKDIEVDLYVINNVHFIFHVIKC